MSVKIMSRIFDNEELGPTQRLILLALADHADDEGRCYPSVSRLCARTGLGERAMQTNIRALERLGYLSIEIGAGRSGSNVYWVRSTPAADAPKPSGNHHRTINDAQSEFDAFWAECPRKVSKGKARQAFAKARKGADATTIIAGMKRHARMVAHTEQQFIPHPATWLNGERWEDEDKPRPVSQQGRKPHWQVMKEKAEGTYRDPEMDAKIARWNRIAAGE